MTPIATSAEANVRPQVAPVRIAVVTVSYNTGPILKDCVAAALADPGVGRLVVVDNGNPAADSDWLQARARGSPRITVLAGQGNIGFAAGCNRGAERANAEVLVFLNPDAVATVGAVGALADALARETRRPCLIGGRVLNPDGRDQRGSRREHPTLWRAFVSFSGLARLERAIPAFRDIHRERDPLPAGPTPTPAVSGAFLAMRSADFAALGGFDERYFLHVEDLDLCRRVERAGGVVLFHPGAVARHARSTSRASRVTVERHKARGLVRYFRKFAGGPLERIAVELCAPFLGLALIMGGALRAGRRN
jgi:hypothetical protein